MTEQSGDTTVGIAELFQTGKELFGGRFHQMEFDECIALLGRYFRSCLVSIRTTQPKSVSIPHEPSDKHNAWRTAVFISDQPYSFEYSNAAPTARFPDASYVAVISAAEPPYVMVNTTLRKRTAERLIREELEEVPETWRVFYARLGGKRRQKVA